MTTLVRSCKEHERCHFAVRVMQDVQVAFLLLRYCLGARLMHLLRGCGSVLRERDGGAPSPVELHDSQHCNSLAALLVCPRDAGLRRSVTASHFHANVWQQAVMPPSMGGVGLACAAMVCECAYLAGCLACLPYLRTHARLLHAPSALGPDSALPTFAALRAAARRVSSASAGPVDFPTLLSASPPAQRALAEGLWARARVALLGAQVDDGGRARVASCGGAYAGAWLDVLPLSVEQRATPEHYRLALAMRLGVRLPEVEVAIAAGRARDCPCGSVHDVYGRHPSVCRRGNRAGLWTTRHDALQWAILAVARMVGRAAHAVGRRNWFSAAALAAAGRDFDHGLYADIALPHYRAPARHLYVDVAITAPEAGGALAHSPSSRDRGGVAAEMRVQKKHRKYKPAVDAMGGVFRAGVMERFGACSDDLVGLVKGLCGDGDRDPASEDWGCTAPTRLRYHMQRVVFAGVMADAAMVDMALSMDVHCTAPEALRRDGARGRFGRAGGGV